MNTEICGWVFPTDHMNSWKQIVLYPFYPIFLKKMEPRTYVLKWFSVFLCILFFFNHGECLDIVDAFLNQLSNETVTPGIVLTESIV